MVIGFILVFIGLAGTAIFVAWRISQRDVTPGEGQAAGEGCGAGEVCQDLSVCCTGTWTPDTDGWCKCWSTVNPGETKSCCIDQPDNETNCNDTVDNDGDGLIDCADPDCNDDPVCGTGGDNCATCGNSCTWCGGGRTNCKCSDFNGKASECWSHGESGCGYNSSTNQCVCGGGGGGGGGAITGSVYHFCNTGTASCDVAVTPDGGCWEPRSSQAECERDQFAECSTITITLAPGQCEGLSAPTRDCGAWQIDATSLCNGWSDADTGCNWIDCEDTPKECGDGILDPGEDCELGDPEGVDCAWATCNHSTCTCPSACGDGVLDAGEQCELGDPSGVTCPWATCDRTSCACPTSQYLQVTGRVYCEDDNGEQYAVEGAQVYFYKGSAQSQNESFLTDANGYYTSAANTTLKAQEPFALRYQGLSDPTKTLPTGALYSQMTGPVLSNPNVCTVGACSVCGTNYEMCNGLTEGMNSGFRWRFSNCGLAANPDWDIDKNGVPVCYEEGTANVYAQVAYTISVTNVNAGGNVDYVEDTYDSSIQSSWIISSSPAGAIIGEDTIRWSLTGDDRVFEEGEEKVYTYTVRIPASLFGDELQNHVVAHLETGDDLHAYESIFVTCGEAPVPYTGLFDNTVVRIGLGVLLVVMSYAYYKFGLLDQPVLWLSEHSGKFANKIRFVASKQGRMERWEHKVMRRADRGGK